MFDKEKFINELHSQISKELIGAARALDERRRDSRILNGIMLVLSATITIFLGVKGIPGSENIAVILGAILTASGGFKVFHRYEEQISNLSKTFHELRLLDSELSFYYKSVPLVDIKEEILIKLKERLQTILRNHAVSVINFKSNEIN